MLLKKNIKLGKIKINLIVLTLMFFNIYKFKQNNANDLKGKFTNKKILDKKSSKNTLIK